MSGKNVHVAPRSGKWNARRAGADHAYKSFETQLEAIASGMETARKEKSALFVHGNDGRISEYMSLGSDSCALKVQR